MKHFRLFSLFVTTALLSLSAACSDNKEDPTPPTQLPSATLTAGTAAETTLDVTVTPENADRCVVKAIEKGETLPTAEELLIDQKATQADPTKSSTVQLENLKPDTEYIVLAAVLGNDQRALSKPLSMRTLPEVPPVPAEPISIEFSRADKERTTEGSWGIGFYDGDKTEGNASHQVFIDFRNEATTTYLPAGTYTFGTSGTGIFHTEYSYIKFLKENGTPWRNITGGKIVVEIPEGNTYRIAMEVTLSDGRDLKAEYEGEIDGMAVIENKDDYLFTLSSASRVKKNGQIAGEYYIALDDSPAWKHEMRLDFYADPASESLPEGTYTIGSDPTPGTLGMTNTSISVYNSGDMTGGYHFSSGKVVVTKEGENYTFAMELTSDDSPHKFVGTFSGPVGNMNLEN